MPNHVQILHPSGSVTGFGRAVGDARRARRLTQEEAAKLLGMSRRKLLDIESDRYLELPRYERAGILAVLSPEREAAALAAKRRTWRRVLLGSPDQPRAWLDIEEESGQWWAAVGFDFGRVGGLDTFKGPFGSREAAERNAAAFGCDFMRARDCRTQAASVARIFGFHQRADSAPLEMTNGAWVLRQKKTANGPGGIGYNIERSGDCMGEMFGPRNFVLTAFKAMAEADGIGRDFEQRYGVEIWLADGRSASE